MPELPPKTVVDVITRVCEPHTHYAIDDLASKLIAKVWLNKIEFKDASHLRNWAWRCVQIELRDHAFRRRNLKCFSEMIGEGEAERRVDWLDAILVPTPSNQLECAEVKRLKKLCRSWPFIHRKVVEILADGGSILDVHKELGLTPMDALRYLQEVREFVTTGNSTPHQGRKKAA